MIRGPDGWRYGVVKWPKSIKPSRLPHYFVKGSSLCGNHYDAKNGFYQESLEPEHPGLKHPCKACRRKFEKSLFTNKEGSS